MGRLEQIKELLDSDSHAEALQLCEHEIQAGGGRGEIALLTARSLVGLARLQEAETWVQRARVDLGDDGDALKLLARIYRRRGWRVRAQAIERRLGAAVSSGSSTPGAIPPSGERKTAPGQGRRVAPTLDAPGAGRASAAMASALPKLVSTSGPDIPTLERARRTEKLEDPVSEDPATVADETASPDTPVVADPLGLLSPEEAEVVRSQGAVKAVVPEKPPGRLEPVVTCDPAIVDEATMEPEPSPVRPAGHDHAQAPAAARPATPVVGLDGYTLQRRRSKLLLVLTTVLVVTIAIAGVVVYRTWKEETRQRTLMTTQRMIDSLDHEGLKTARDEVRQALGNSSQPDGALCARGAQVDLYLWMYFTGDRTTLQQARDLLEEAELRDPEGVETRFTRALWEGYLGDAARSLRIVSDLQDAPSLRNDRLALLRGVAASAVGDHARAARTFEEAVSLTPSALNHLSFARAAERCGTRTDAQDQLEGILSNHPGHLLAEVDLALLRAGRHTEKSTLRNVEQIQEQYNGVVPARVMSRILAAEARAYGAQSNFKACAERYNRALETDPENPDILLAFGRELRIRGDLRDARTQVSRIVKNQPHSGDALGEMAIIAYLQDRPGFLARKIETFPEGAGRSAAVALATGLLALMNEEPQEAIEALQRTPEDLWGGESRMFLAEAQLAAGDAVAARASFDTAVAVLRLHRGKSDPLVSAAAIGAQRAASRAGQRVDEQQVTRALGAHGRIPVVLYHHALLAEERGEVRRASAFHRKGFERGQDFSLALVGYLRTSADQPGSERLRRVAADTYLRISPDGPHAEQMRRIAR